MEEGIEIKDFLRWIPFKGFLQVRAALGTYFTGPGAGNEDEVFILENVKMTREEFLMRLLGEVDQKMNESPGNMYFPYEHMVLGNISHSAIEIKRIDGFPTFFLLGLEDDDSRDAEDKLVSEMGIERGLQFVQVSIPLSVEGDHFILDCADVIKRLRTIGAFQFMETDEYMLACLFSKANETGITPFPELCDNGFQVQFSLDGVCSPHFRTLEDDSFAWVKQGVVVKGRLIKDSVPVMNFFIQKSSIGKNYSALPFIGREEKDRCRAVGREIAAAFEEK